VGVPDGGLTSRPTGSVIVGRDIIFTLTLIWQLVEWSELVSWFVRGPLRFSPSELLLLEAGR
jgi:hypothetical protein